MNENEEVKIEEKIPAGAEDVTPEEVKDDVYRLEEMKDEMGKSIDNLEKVKMEQQYLIDILSKVNDEKLKALIGELKRQLDNITTQTTTLQKRHQLVDSVCKVCETNPEIRSVINDLLLGLGAFPQA